MVVPPVPSPVPVPPPDIGLLEARLVLLGRLGLDKQQRVVELDVAISEVEALKGLPALAVAPSRRSPW